MIIEESFTVAAPRETVADFLLNPTRMSRCVPGVGEVVASGDDSYEATLTVRVGPIQARFAGEVTIDSSGAPGKLRAVARGRDGATGSQAQVDFTAVLVEVDSNTTEVRSTSDVTIRGKLGQFGTGVITSTARAMVGEFALCAGAALASPSGDIAAPSIARVARRGLVSYLDGLVAAIGAWLLRLGRKRR